MIGKLTEPYHTGGGPAEDYKDYAKSFEEACARMLGRVDSIPKFRVLSVQDIDVSKFYWRLVEMIYEYE